jgi:hypothetical protein
LSVPNFRRYVSGQAVTLVGTWMETVALALLVLQLNASGHGARPDHRGAVRARAAAGASPRCGPPPSPAARRSARPSSARIAEHAGARWSLGLGGAACGAAAVIGLALLRHTTAAVDQSASPGPTKRRAPSAIV